MAEKVGILCLSKRPDCILMWSHYAASHTGYVLGFTIENDAMFFVAPSIVNYTTAYPNISYIQNREQSVKESLRTKAAEWKYEEEVRIIRPKPGLDSFKKECLTQVILGCRVSDENKRKMEQILSEPAYEHVVLKHAKVSESAFVLNLEATTIQPTD